MPVETDVLGVASDSFRRRRARPSTPGVFDVHPIAFGQRVRACRGRMHQQARLGRNLARPSLLAEARVVILLLAIAGDEFEG